MYPSPGKARRVVRLAFALATSSALLHCSGVDGITTAPDPDAGDDTQTDAGRHHDSGSSSSADAGGEDRRERQIYRNRAAAASSGAGGAAEAVARGDDGARREPRRVEVADVRAAAVG